MTRCSVVNGLTVGFGRRIAPSCRRANSRMTYEYLCTACGHAWEAEQSISAAPLTTCPNCHQEAAKRQVSGGAGFILKGGGWYADLYSSSSKSGGDAKASDTKTTSDTPATKSDGAA